jgi:lysine 2,3-aminomutase
MEDALHNTNGEYTGDTGDATDGLVTGEKDGCDTQSSRPRKVHGWPRQAATTGQWRDWRWQFANRVRDLASLTELLEVPFHERHIYEELTARYPYAITPYYFSMIDWMDPKDPIKRQCVPDLREILFSLPGSEEDPLAERAHTPVPGLIHRYPDRVLAMVTGTCATYCRHCNRKRTWKRPEAVGSSPGLERILDYVKGNAGIREVILSGGDPLVMDLRILDEFLGALRSIPHVEVLRIGTRVPVVLPMRINDTLCRVLARHRPLWINTHFNHPREITPEAAAACDRLLKTGIPVSNQTVLLKGINDTADIILRLCNGLQRIMVRPYYLFHCDAVRGTDHFRTDIRKGVEITEALWGQTGGLCIPNFVVDLPSGGGKARMIASHLLSIEKDTAVFRTFEGRLIRYPCPEGAET